MNATPRRTLFQAVTLCCLTAATCSCGVNECSSVMEADPNARTSAAQDSPHLDAPPPSATHEATRPIA